MSGRTRSAAELFDLRDCRIAFMQINDRTDPVHLASERADRLSLTR